ncbi:hypothetical protein DJ69_04420 [Halorubrum persicum]|uniref:DUF7993 domain-containing protein n=1 Tax=Halorubrum persicum TaxID=1383844 RepID=A0A2G1WLE5_9EURY|nr:hypothetical protein [Halorubrum persicum]PHQ39773.1 hypothetical protein DJ69_04420 [Halorubrum persicum]
MVDERLTDGVRIGQLLASEISGNEGRLRDLALSDADPDAEPTPDGALAYRVVRDGGSAADLVAEAYVQPDRLRVEFVGGVGRDDGSDATDIPEVVADAAGGEGLRVRPKAVRPPRTLVFVENGAQVKRVLPVFEAVVDAVAKSE